MIDVQHIKRILKVNRISKDSSNKDIEAVLKSAGFTDFEHTFSLLENDKLKTNPNETDEAKILAVKDGDNILLTDSRLNTDQIGSLLGIKVKDNFGNFKEELIRREGMPLSHVLTLLLVLTATVVAVLTFF